MNIHGVPIASHPNGHLRNKSVSDREYRFSFFSIRLDVYPSMEVIRTWFSEIASQRYSIMDRQSERNMSYQYDPCEYVQFQYSLTRLETHVKTLYAMCQCPDADKVDACFRIITQRI